MENADTSVTGSLKSRGPNAHVSLTGGSMNFQASTHSVSGQGMTSQVCGAQCLSSHVCRGWARALLEGEGGHWGQSQGGRRAVTGDVQAVEGGGFWRLGMRLGAGFGVWERLWGRVSAVGRGEGVPPPLFKRFPGLGVGITRAELWFGIARAPRTKVPAPDVRSRNHHRGLASAPRSCTGASQASQAHKIR